MAGDEHWSAGSLQTNGLAPDAPCERTPPDR
jgi:hypothetical protein